MLPVMAIATSWESDTSAVIRCPARSRASRPAPAPRPTSTRSRTRSDRGNRDRFDTTRPWRTTTIRTPRRWPSTTRYFLSVPHVSV